MIFVYSVAKSIFGCHQDDAARARDSHRVNGVGDEDHEIDMAGHETDERQRVHDVI